MSLYFISIGLYDEKDMSLKAIEAAKSCDILFAEFYTHKLNTTLQKLEQLVGKKIFVLSRKEVEESDMLLKEAEKNKVGLLVGGDAFCATTHLALKYEAMKRGIETKVIHGSSIFSAVGEVGLHMYKFGSTVTIPFLDRLRGRLPISAYERLKDNKERGLHTLILFDIVEEEKRYMTVREAIDILLKMEEVAKQDVFTEHSEIIVFARAGSDDAKIVFGQVVELKDMDFGNPPFSIIVPGSLHFTEKEYLELLKNDKR
ncbi:MAG: diphthine synthase [Candidatus Aenigmarchaeota archaeon]|nr:diphthine synthase [Candidatus Aenigmarchaeota archaeon]